MIDQPESAFHSALRDGRCLLADPMILIDLAQGLHRGDVVANFIKDCAYRMTFAAWADKESGGLERLTAALDGISGAPRTSVELIRLMFGSLREQAATLNWQDGISLAESHGPQHEACQTLGGGNGTHYATLRALVILTDQKRRSVQEVAKKIASMLEIDEQDYGGAEVQWADNGLRDLRAIGLVDSVDRLNQSRKMPTYWSPTAAGRAVCQLLESLAEIYRDWPEVTAGLLRDLRKLHPVPDARRNYGSALVVEMTLMVALGHEESRSRMLMDVYLGPILQSVVQLAAYGRTSDGIPGPDSGHGLAGGG